MSARRKKQVSLPHSILPAARKFISKSALAPGEEARAYEALVQSVSSSLEPQDVIECMLVRDIAQWQWDVQRLKTIEAALLSSQASDGPLQGDPYVLKELEVWMEAKRKYQNEAEQDEYITTAMKDFEATRPKVTPQRLTSDLVQFYKRQSGEIERLSRMVAAAESHRNAALREFDRYRDLTNGKTRILDAEYNEPALSLNAPSAEEG
jgi:hypothetical protein